MGGTPEQPWVDDCRLRKDTHTATAFGICLFLHRLIKVSKAVHNLPLKALSKR